MKGDGDADWVTVSDAVADPASGTPVSVDVNRTNVQLWFYNLTASQNAYMTELEILGNVEVAPRTFKDFTFVTLFSTEVLIYGVAVFAAMR